MPLQNQNQTTAKERALARAKANTLAEQREQQKGLGKAATMAAAPGTTAKERALARAKANTMAEQKAAEKQAGANASLPAATKNTAKDTKKTTDWKQLLASTNAQSKAVESGKAKAVTTPFETRTRELTRAKAGDADAMATREMKLGNATKVEKNNPYAKTLSAALEGVGSGFANALSMVQQGAAKIEEAYAPYAGTSHAREEMGYQTTREAAAKKNKAAYELTQKKADALSESSAKHTEEAKEGQGTLGQLAVDLGVQGVQMGTDIALGAVTGGGALVPMAVRVFGQGAQEARQEGASYGQQLAYGAASAAIETATEKLFDGLAGAYGKSWFSKTQTAKNISESLNKKLASRPAGRAALKLLGSMAGEGAEEVISGIVNPIAKTIYNDQGIRESYRENFDWSETLYEGLVGALMGGIGGAVEVPGNYRNGKVRAVSNAIDNYYDAIEKKGLYSKEAQTQAEKAQKTIERLTGEKPTVSRKKNAEEPEEPRYLKTAEELGQETGEPRYLKRAEEQAAQEAEEPRYLKTAEELAAEPTLEELMGNGRATVQQQEDFIRKYGEDTYNRLVVGAMENGRIDSEGNELVWKTEEPRYLQRAEEPTQQQLQADEPRYLRTAEGQTAQEMQTEEPRYLKTAEEMELEEPGVHGDTAWMSRKDASYLSQLAKTGNVSIEVVDTLGDAQGTYDPKTGRIQIARDATDPVGFVTQHELTHRMKQSSPEKWSQFLGYVQEHYGEDWSGILEGYQRRYAEHGIALTAEEAAEEAAADFAGNMDENEIRKLTQENRSLAEKILDAIRSLIRKLKGGENQKLYEMEKLWASALKEGNKNTAGRRNAESARNRGALQSARDGATINEKTTKTEEGTNNDESRTRGTGNAAQENGQNRGRKEAVQGTATEAVRRGIVLGGQRELTPSFGEKPRRTWAEGHTVEPVRGSAAYAEQQTAMEYGVPSFVVADDIWDANKGKTPAFSANGQIYFRENVPQKNVGMLAYHELTHVMKQTGYEPYLKFTKGVAERLNMNSDAAHLLLEHEARHRKIDIFGKDGTLDLRKLHRLSDAERLKLYDELNATLYGHIGSGKLDGLSGYLEAAFYDFPSYAAELREIHEGFKQRASALKEGNKNTANEGGVRYSIKRTSKMTLAEQLKMYYDGKMASSDAFYFGETPANLSAAGLDALPLAMAISDFRKSSKEKHNVPRRVWNNLRSDIQNALFAVENGDRIGIMTDDIDGDGKPLLVGIEKNAEMDRELVNIVQSAYGLDNPAAWLKNQAGEGKNFVPLNMEKASAFLQTYGAYLASVGDGSRFEIRIAEDAAKSNTQNAEKTKKSLKGSKETAAETERLREQNRRLEKEITALKDQVRMEIRSSTDRRGTEQAVREMVKRYGSKANKAELTEALLDLYDGMATGALSRQEMRDLSRRAADTVIDNAEVNTNPLYEEYEELRKELRTEKVTLAKESRSDIKDGYNEVRKRAMGKVKIGNDGTPVDVQYEMLNDRYPELFPDDIYAPADQLQRMVDVAESLQKVMENPFQGQEGESIRQGLANDILEQFFDISTTQGAKLQKMQWEWEKQRAKDREATGRRFERSRERQRQKIAELKQEYAEANRRRQGAQTATALRDSIGREALRMSRKLTRPTDKNHVPEEYRGAVAELVRLIDTESGYDIETTRDGKFIRVKKGEGQPTKKTDAARALKAEIEKIQANGNLTVDPEVQEYLNEIADMKDIPLADMNRSQLETVWKVVRAVSKMVTDSNRMFGESKYATVSKAAETLRKDNGERKDRRQRKGALGTAQSLFGIEMMTPETYFHELGSAGEEVFRQFRNAADEQTRILKEATDTAAQAVEDSGLDVRKLEKQTKTFTLESGEKVTLTRAQLMELYELTKREQAMEHIFLGGVKSAGYEVKGKTGKRIETPSKASKVTMNDVGKMLKELTPAEKKLADTLQKYMGGALAEHGNRASYQVYGYNKFTEKNYWPIRVNKGEVQTDVGAEAKSKTIPSFGMTRAVTPHASNGLMLNSFMDTYTEHINQMATYAAWLGASENASRLYNYQFRDGEGHATGDTVKNLFQKVYGRGGTQYFDKLMSDIAQGTKTGANQAPTDKLFSNYKAAAVGANLRVVMQQPTAILRAAEMINPKYLIRNFGKKGGWDKAVKYAPIAQWKDWGYFELDTGRSLRQLILGSEGKLEKMRETSMIPAGWGDSIAWGLLWNAVEDETTAKHPQLRRGSQEFYDTAAERFTDIIYRTQVVDNVLNRSQAMRKNGVWKLATSFMSEPSKVYNMMQRDINDLTRAKEANDTAAMKKAEKHIGRTAVALVASFAVNAVAQAAADAARDDDRDETPLEKFGEKWWDNFWGNFNPVGYVPFAKDVLSVMQGYDVERMDMSAFADSWSALQTAYKAWIGTGSKTKLAASMDAALQLCKIAGLPAYNVKREVHALIGASLLQTGQWRALYELDKLLLNPEKNRGQFYDTLYYAMLNDWDAYEKIYANMLKHGFDEDGISDGMENRMKKAEEVKYVKQLPIRWAPPGTADSRALKNYIARNRED